MHLFRILVYEHRYPTFKSLTCTLSIVSQLYFKSLTYTLVRQLPSHGATNPLPRAAGPPSGGIAVAREISDDTSPRLKADSTVSCLFFAI
jgi:hypothetical protein